MPVETRPTSKYWYGRWRRNGVRKCKKLKVIVCGTPGTKEFEQSRTEAEGYLAKMIAEDDRARRPEELVQSLHELKFGNRIGSIRLVQLAEEWLALPRKRPLSKGRVTFGRTVITSFVDHVRENHPKVHEMSAVTPKIAESFMATESKRGVSGRTYNAALALLRGAFERLRVQAGMLANPFKHNLVLKDENPTPRKPFTLPELTRLFEKSRTDREIHDLIVTGACTALRRGDACCLKWEDVNLATNRIRVQTRKTGEKVAIPIFPRLREVLLSRTRNGSPYVFPSLAADYLREASGINRRLNAAFTAAGLRGDENDEGKEGERAPAVIDIPSEDDMRPLVMAKIQALTDEKASPTIRAIMLRVFDLYSSGMTLPDITTELKMSKGSVSNYFKRIERIAGHPIVRREVKLAQRGDSGETKAKKPSPQHGLIHVNARGFHALRATFTTLALAAGIPVEVVKMITGHSITATVLKHYFNPTEQTVFEKVETAMPMMLTGGTGRKTLRAEITELIDRIAEKKTKQDVEKLKELAARITT